MKRISEISRIPKRNEGKKTTFIPKDKKKKSRFVLLVELLLTNSNKPVHGGRLWSVAPVIHALHATHLLQLGAKFIENTRFDA